MLQKTKEIYVWYVKKTILSMTVANYSILPNNINGSPKMTYADSSIYIKTMLRLAIKWMLITFKSFTRHLIEANYKFNKKQLI